MIYETKSYLFMTFAEWFYVDENYKLHLTELGKSIPEVVESYKKYQEES